MYGKNPVVLCLLFLSLNTYSENSFDSNICLIIKMVRIVEISGYISGP